MTLLLRRRERVATAAMAHTSLREMCIRQLNCTIPSAAKGISRRWADTAIASKMTPDERFIAPQRQVSGERLQRAL